MAITGADVPGMAGAAAQSGLTRVRRFEAAGFRAWPAAHVHYDGTWAIRLTPGHPGKRLNSVNPLDPADSGDVAERLARAADQFAAAGASLVLRLSPLAAPAIASHLDAAGWTRSGLSHVMAAQLSAFDFSDVLDQLPVRDVQRFATAHAAVRGGDGVAVARVVSRIEPEAGMFVHEVAGRPAATAICVQDADLAGLFEVATAADHRRAGHARRTVLTALKWARLRGARIAWLQVEADNRAALDLYSSLGFSTLYSYHYRRPPEGHGR